jgi:adenylate cyclase
MSQIFISYARSTAAQAQTISEALRALGYGVWLDDELPAHRAYTDVIEERLRQAKAVVVLWSAEAAKSQWVRAEAEVAREAGTLVQVTLDGSVPPLPFNQIQCADLADWTGDSDVAGWRKALESITDLVGAPPSVAAATSASPPALPDKPSIAVLPFADMTGAKEHDYFCDGMVMEIVAALSRFGSLFVIASDSSLTYRGGGHSRPTIARELGVRYLLEGSVRRSGDKVRIAVQLIEATASAPLWNERFDGTLEDVFALQDTVANAVAAQIAPTVEAIEVRRARARPTEDLGAYDLYLRALHAFRFGAKVELLRAVSLLHEAIARDPQYAPALALLGFVHTTTAIYGFVDDPAEIFRAGLDFARRALRVSSEDAEVLVWAGWTIAMASDDMATGEALVERARLLNPGESNAWQRGGMLKIYSGKPQVALDYFETALRFNPRARSSFLFSMGWALLFLRRFDDAIVAMRQAVELWPDYEGPAVGLVAALAHRGRIDEAKAVLSEVRPDTISAMFGFFRHPDCQEVIRSGLALAGAAI